MNKSHLGFLSPSAIIAGIVTLLVTAAFAFFYSGVLYTAGDLNARDRKSVV